MGMGQLGGGGVALPTGIGLSSTPKPCPNQYKRGVVAILFRVGTTASEPVTTPVGMGAYPDKTSDRPQSPPQRPLL